MKVTACCCSLVGSDSRWPRPASPGKKTSTDRRVSLQAGNPLVFAGYRLLLTEPPLRLSNVQSSSSSSSSLIVSNLSAVFGTHFLSCCSLFLSAAAATRIASPIVDLAVGSELVRTLRLEGETDSGWSDRQSSMQWGSIDASDEGSIFPSSR